ncbi:glycosyltransferase family 2 protein [Fulvimonas sp. R45]|uniref:glycosyltransferase family 2 protein n=1 Tax=Fulvimonas sp. R45 TaxID=3045937 RepID=UPI00265F9E4D|nr:glycosyltransferase family 2 protein [Fulvimonas sp. R45]MDO1527784.1 glycosyltransferase family 2 protein [Fulvimonas sp. R45]
MVSYYPSLNRPEAPDCSVCIANYNGIRWLADCIESVLAQQGDATCEILIHDDASTDGSVAWLREHYPQVEVLASSENVGFCIGNNRMVAHARGEYVLLLNNDAALHANALATFIAASRKQATAGILTLPQYDWTSGQLVDRGCLLDPFYNPVPNLDAARADVAYAIGACLFLPRELWNELGGFPEWMGSIAEDIYLCCLARLRGAPVMVLSHSGFRHRLGATFGGARVRGNSLKTTLRRRHLSERNKTYALFVCTPGPSVWVLLMVHLLALLLEGGILSTLKWDRGVFSNIYAKVPVSLFRDFGRLRAIRRCVQAGRTTGARIYFRPFTWVPSKVQMLFRFGIPEISA